MREILPRGLHHLIVTRKNGNPNSKNYIQDSSFRGILKFTGLNPGDEDEESNSTKENFLFFEKKLVKQTMIERMIHAQKFFS